MVYAVCTSKSAPLGSEVTTESPNRPFVGLNFEVVTAVTIVEGTVVIAGTVIVMT